MRINWRRWVTTTVIGLFPPENWSELVDDVRSLEITSFIGGRFSRSPGGGTSLEVNAQTLAGAAIGFQLFNATVSDGMGGFTKKIRIALGTLQDLSVGGTTWIPTGMTAGDAPANWYIVPVSGTGFAWLVVTYDPTSGIVSSVTLNTGSTVPAQTSGTNYLSLGTFDAATLTNAVIVTGAINDQACKLCGLTLGFGPS